MHRHLLHNGEIRDVSERFLSPGQTGVVNGWGVFSTLRVMDGTLFAFERHWARMVRDAQRMHVPMPPDAGETLGDLHRLIAANEAWNSTLRIMVVRNTGGAYDSPGIIRPFDVIAFTKDLTQWSSSVRLAWKADARHGANPFAGAKILSWAPNLTWYEEARQRGYDEVVLLDEHGRVSECTSANLFAIFGSDIVTPALDSGCLPGITREVLLGEISVPGLSIHEGELRAADLERADAVFMTSSTRELLAVREIEGLRLREDGSPALPALQKAFSRYMREYQARVPHRKTTSTSVLG